MARAPLRRGQLIAPFGVGSMVIVRNGISLIAAGLDHWFKREDGVRADHGEYIIDEWRLSRQLQTHEFRTPPDFRRPGQDVPNVGITVPFLRFPLTHTCPKCGWLKESPLVERTSPRCRYCSRIMSQVALVTICENGHIQDFPWREWVHGQVTPECKKDLYFVSTGSATLAGQKVKCSCGKQRSLSGVTFENVLTKSLEKGTDYVCPGKRPWLGHVEGESCGKRVVVVLRSASNTYFAQTQSAIYIPRGGTEVSNELIETLERPVVYPFVKTFGESLDPQVLKNSSDPEISEPLKRFTVEEIRAGIRHLVSEKKPENNQPKEEVDFRREEFHVLRNRRNDKELRISEPEYGQYDSSIRSIISRVTLVEKLRETRALCGFTRVISETSEDLKNLKARLRRADTQGTWLPAYAVFGEGIFLELDETALQAWLRRNKEEIEKRITPFQKRMREHQKALQLKEKSASARLLLVHTLAHLLINQLIFECEYSAASLRERLYVSDDQDHPMAGLLIYTASGDADGTMGGLVRMGKAGVLEPIIQKAVENATWCSADPVCMETGSGSGQGPAGLNLAACHGCSLLPETSCEQFNQALDRGMIVGDLKGSLEGFFASLLPSSAVTDSQ